MHRIAQQQSMSTMQSCYEESCWQVGIANHPPRASLVVHHSSQTLQHLHGSPSICHLVDNQVFDNVSQLLIAHHANVFCSSFWLRYMSARPSIEWNLLRTWIGPTACRHLAHHNSHREHVGLTALRLTLPPHLWCHVQRCADSKRCGCANHQSA
jgi:hypothetical protein